MTTTMPAIQSRGQTESVCPKGPAMPGAWDRWEVLDLVQDLKKALGLKDRDIMVLRAHLTVLPSGPLHPDQLNLSFMKVSEILKRACAMEERRFNRGEVRLEEVGLAFRKLSANGRRFPERDATGQIIGGYGIDLSPLLSRLDELSQLRDKIQAERLELRQKRNQVSARFQCILRELYALGTDLPAHIVELKDRLRNVLRRKGITLKDLEVLDAQVASLEDAPCPIPNNPLSSSALTESAEHVEQKESPIEAPIGPEDDTKPEDDARQTVWHIESKLKERYKDRPFGFDERRISSVWRNTRSLQSFYPEPPSRERDAAGVIFEFSSYLGLGQQVMIRALTVFGWENLIEVVDYLALRVEKLKQPEGYLTTMIKCFERGEPVAGGSVQPARLPRNRTAV